jgi:hypothetical protein
MYPDAVRYRAWPSMLPTHRHELNPPGRVFTLASSRRPRRHRRPLVTSWRASRPRPECPWVPPRACPWWGHAGC